jgi:hypothetical protein
MRLRSSIEKPVYSCAMTTRGGRGALAIALLALGASPSCTATANVSDAWMSLDQDGGRHRNVFFTDTKEIFCIADIVTGRNNATLEMQLRRLQTFDFTKNDFTNVDIVSSYMEERPAVSKTPTPVVLRVPRTSVDAQGGSRRTTTPPSCPAACSARCASTGS